MFCCFSFLRCSFPTGSLFSKLNKVPPPIIVLVCMHSCTNDKPGNSHVHNNFKPKEALGLGWGEGKLHMQAGHITYGCKDQVSLKQCHVNLIIAYGTSALLCKQTLLWPLPRRYTGDHHKHGVPLLGLIFCMRRNPFPHFLSTVLTANGLNRYLLVPVHRALVFIVDYLAMLALCTCLQYKSDQ